MVVVMVRTQLLAVTSTEQVLAVGLAFGDIISVNYLPYAETGTVVGCTVLVKNTGDTGSNMNVNFWWVNADLYGGVARQDMGWSDEGDQYIGPGEQKWFTKASLVTMPAGDAWMKARAFLTGFLWSEWCDDYDFTIEQLILVAMSLTLSVAPINVPLGAPVTCTGRLARTDTGAIVSGAPIAIRLYIGGAWTTQVTGNTDASGDYSLRFNAPVIAGSYGMHAYYGGSAVFGAALSKAVGLAVSGFAVPSVLPIAVLLLSGASLAYVGARTGSLRLPRIR